MKLRNKKTGEIGYLIVGRGSDHYVVANNEWSSCGKYNSLAELNEEWEDYEDDALPKGYWTIEPYGKVEYIELNKRLHWSEELYHQFKNFGNCFKTEEEAEKALEKLKAWKRLKDKFDISFSGMNRNKTGRPVSVNLDFKREGRTTFDEAKQNTDDLNLIFGGEE